MIRCDHSNCIAPGSHCVVDTDAASGDEFADRIYCDRHFAELSGALERASLKYHDLLARGVHPAMAERVVDGMMGE